METLNTIDTFGHILEGEKINSNSLATKPARHRELRRGGLGRTHCEKDSRCSPECFRDT